jgi:hypothetical protein
VRRDAVLEFVEAPERDLAEGDSRPAEPLGPEELRARRLVVETQLEQPDLLLAGRVGDYLVDAMRDFCRTGERRFGELVGELAPVVTVKPVPRLLRALRRDLFAMRVVIMSPRPDLLRRIFEAVGSPAGIGVDIVRGGLVEPQLQGSCVVGGGRSGTVAGSVETPNGTTFRPTCAHAVAPDCPSTRPSPPPPPQWREVTYLPDAVLLDGRARCFELGAVHPVLAAENSQIRKLVARCARVRRAGGRGGGHGRLQSRVVGIPNSHGDGLCNFSSLMIDPRRRLWLLWDSPLRGRGFSQEGDSGSWVVDEEERIWIGMVVSGTRDHSYAHEAGPLLRWLEQETGGEPAKGWKCMCSAAS